MKLTNLQKKLLNLLQEGLPLCERPFHKIALGLDSNEKIIIKQVKLLKKRGFIKRINAIINYPALSKTGTLVAAHVPQENLQDVIKTVNNHEGVSHSYLRKHHFNLWFTLQADTNSQIQAELAKFSTILGVDFHSLPVAKVFKLKVHFDPETKNQFTQGKIHRPTGKPVKLNKDERNILSQLQNELQIISRPFDFLSGQCTTQEKPLKIIQRLIKKGVIRRIAAIVDYHKLGFTANVLFCCQVDKDKIDQAGRKLARFGIVSHCYHRKTFSGWPYNLFAMMHAGNMGDIQRVIDKFVKAEKIDSYLLLPTVKELKKSPVKWKNVD